MPTKNDPPRCSISQARRLLLVDTSVAVALVVADHTAHKSTIKAVGGRELGLSGHAAFETFSVLTRLPSPARVTHGAAARIIAANFPNTRFIKPETANSLIQRFSSLGVSGGAVYDALVATAAEGSGLTLATRDRRAADTYRKFDVDLEIFE